MSTPTWYDVLDVERSASADEIRAAWRAGIADLEPTERRFATLNEAAAVLLDPARRSAYDEELRAAEPEPEPATEPEAEPEIEPEIEPEAQEQPDARAAAAEPVEAPAASTEASERPSPDPTEEKPRKAAYMPSGWLLATVAVIALVCAVLASVLAGRPSADKVIQADAQLSSGTKVTQVEQHALDAQSAAKEAAVPILSYDYRHLEADKAKADGFLTDSYRGGQKGYDNLFEQVVKGPATTTQTVITTKIISSAIVRADTDRVQVLLFIDQSRTNKSSATPAVFQNQVTMTMQKVGDRWLVDGMNTSQIPD